VFTETFKKKKKSEEVRKTSDELKTKSNKLFVFCFFSKKEEGGREERFYSQPAAAAADVSSRVPTCNSSPWFPPFQTGPTAWRTWPQGRRPLSPADVSATPPTGTGPFASTQARLSASNFLPPFCAIARATPPLWSSRLCKKQKKWKKKVGRKRWGKYEIVCCEEL
jgi:hypothetical protein